MNTVNLLLGNSEEPINDLLEALVQEVCGDRAAVKSIRTGRTDEFIRLSCEQQFELLILVPHELSPDPSEPAMLSHIGEAVRTIRLIRSQNATPLVAIVSPENRQENEPLLMSAGAHCLLELPLNHEGFKATVGRLLDSHLQSQPSAPARQRKSFFGF